MDSNHNIDQIVLSASLRKIYSFLDKYDSGKSLAKRSVKTRHTLKFLLDILFRQLKQDVCRLSIDTTVVYISKCTKRSYTTIYRHLKCLQEAEVIIKAQTKAQFKGRKHITPCINIAFNPELFAYANITAETLPIEKKEKLSTSDPEISAKDAIKQLISKYSATETTPK